MGARRAPARVHEHPGRQRGDLRLRHRTAASRPAVTFDPARDRDPAWSPDGTRLVFAERCATATRSSTSSPPPAGLRARLTVDPADDRQPAWSSTGAIAFASNRTGDFDLYSMAEDGSAVRPLTQEPGIGRRSRLVAGRRPARVHPQPARRRNALDVRVSERGRDRMHGRSPPWRHGALPQPGRPTAPASPTRRGLRAAGLRDCGRRSAGSGDAGRIGDGARTGAPLPAPVGDPDVGRTITIAPLDARVLVAPATTQPPATSSRCCQPGCAAPARCRRHDRRRVRGHDRHRGGDHDARRARAPSAAPRSPAACSRSARSGPPSRRCGCGAASGPASAAAGRRRVPPEARMRIRARGRFRTVGGYGRGAGRGTEWVDARALRRHDLPGLRGRRPRPRLPPQAHVPGAAGRCYLAAVRRRADALKPARKCPRVRAAR